MKAVCSFILFSISIFSTSIEKGVEPIRFQIKNAGITVDGTISDWEYDIVWDAKKLANCKISGRANPASIDTGIKLRDKHLQGRQYFHVEKFSFISLQSKIIVAKGKGNYTGTFDLQIRDVIKEIEIPFTIVTSSHKQYFKAEFNINRLDFNIGESSLVLGDEVRVEISLEK
ncbi:MAG TPA: YceI family protein [Cyclobacteriaceae bacterium]|nr:YceI family protein [Cyclobacteriaceae bacterium]